MLETKTMGEKRKYRVEEIAGAMDELEASADPGYTLHTHYVVLIWSSERA